MFYLLAALLLLAGAPPRGQTQAPQTPTAVDVDPAIRVLVDRFFETQQKEDVQGYLALWSAKAKRPSAEQLRYVFDSGDDEFSDIVVTHAAITGDTARIRVRGIRVRLDTANKRPDGTPRRLTMPVQLALTLVREVGSPEWKIVREGLPTDELAAAIIEADDPEARRRILQSDPELLNVRLVESLARRADELAQVEQYRAAQAIYERGLEIARLIGNKKAEGQALGNVANSLYFQRDFPGALKLYEQRLALERESANDEGAANALLGIATVQYATYDYGAALASYREALAIQEKLNDELLVANTLISTGNVLYLQGDYEAAIADYSRAERLKRQFMDLAGAASALEGLGRVYTAQGDYAAALGAFAGVLDERRRRADVVRGAMVLQSIGEIHFRLGNIDQARTSYADARTDFLKVKAIGHAGRVLQGTAMTELVAGRSDHGEKAYAESIELCTKANDFECIAHAQVGLAFALAAQQKFDDAILWYGRSIESFTALEFEEAAARARVGLSEAQSGKGEYAKALDEAVSARHTAIAISSDDLLWRALVSQARAERKLQKPVLALGTARAALLAVQRMAATALERPGQAAGRDTATAFATVAILQAEAGDATGAFATTEAMRAHVLRAALAANERDIARGMSDEERAEERRLASELNSVLVKRDRQQDLPKPDKAVIAKLDATVAALTKERSAWREKLFGRLPDLKVWRGLAAPAMIDELTRLLDAPGKALLQFVVDEHDTLVITATAATAEGSHEVTAPQISAQVVTIERQELAERIARALDAKSLASVEVWRKSSTELFSILPQETRERLAASASLVVIPDDVLWRVPFEAMPVGTGYLADRTSVAYAASVGAMMNVPASPDPDPKAPIVIVASPQLSPELLEELKTTAPTWSIRTEAAASPEVERITKASGDVAPVVLSGADATAERLRGPGISSSTAMALHIAAPFRINSASPLFSPILLTPPFDSPEPRARSGQAFDSSESRTTHPTPRAARPGRNAELEVRDLFDLDPIAPVVMLSDPAALSKRDGAAAAHIVDWAWRAAGAKTTIFKRWGGDEAVATDVIGKFYEGLRAGKSAPEALHAARSAVRGTEAGRHPAAWAGWLIQAGR